MMPRLAAMGRVEGHRLVMLAPQVLLQLYLRRRLVMGMRSSLLRGLRTRISAGSQRTI